LTAATLRSKKRVETEEVELVMNMKLWIVAVTGAVALTLPFPAYSQTGPQQCDERSRVLKHLAKKYKEVPVALGVTGSGKLIEVLRDNSEKGNHTWTIIETSPQGVSCLLAAGDGWRFLEETYLFDPKI
jgi:hypothetical protein